MDPLQRMYQTTIEFASSISTNYKYPAAYVKFTGCPGSVLPIGLNLLYPSSTGDAYEGNAPADPHLPVAGGNGGGKHSYTNVDDVNQGLGAQGMFAEFRSTGTTGITGYYGTNAGAVNTNAGSNASNKFQSGNGGKGRTGASAAVMTGGNGGVAAGGGGGGSVIQASGGGGDGGDGGNGYCIVYSW